MNRCPWCGDKAKVKRDPLGYIFVSVVLMDMIIILVILCRES